METYRGQVKSPSDAIILFEACRLGNLPRVQRRLSEKERQMISSGSVFVWDEREAGMKRWTDGKSWSASRVAGSFLTYREMEGKRGGSAFNSPSTGSGMGHVLDAMDTSDAPDGYRYKPDGLMKQSFSITTAAGQHLHLISYWARALPTGIQLPVPSTDPSLRHIHPEKGMYPEATVNEAQSMPAVTRSPMDLSPYAISPSPSHPHATSYLRHAPPQIQGGYGWPASPMRSPRAHFPTYSPGYYQANGHAGSAGPSPLQHHQSAFSPHSMPTAGLTAFDRAPPPMRGTGIPPPPQQQQQQQRGLAPLPTYPQHPQTYPHQPPYSSHPSQDPQPRDPRYSNSTPPHTQNGSLSAPHGHFTSHPYPTHSSHDSTPNGTSPKPMPLRYEDVQRPHHIRNLSSRSSNGSAATEPGKTIPSINSLINKTPSPPHSAPHGAPPPSMPPLGIGIRVAGGGADGTPPYGHSNRPPQGDRQPLKDLSTGKGFGEDHRALRKLDKAFAL